jgi:DNA replication protein DnaC
MHDKEEQATTSRRKQQQEKEQKQANFRVMVGVDALAWTVEDKEPPASSAINVFVTGQPGVGKTSLVLNAVKKLPKDMIAGFYTLEARNPRTGEKVGLDIGESDGKFKAHHLCGL